MKKRIAIIAIVVLVLLLVVAHFIPSYNQKEILLLSPIMHPARELNSAAEWQRWNPIVRKYCLENPSACAISNNSVQSNFTIKAGQSNFVIAVHGASYDITETSNGNSTSYNYTLVPSLHNDSTGLIVTENTNLLSTLLSLGNTNASIYADSLKRFIENPSAFYGFLIRLSPVIDTFVVSTHRVVPHNNAVATLKDLYKKLDSFIQANHLTMVRPRIGHFEPGGKDSLDVIVGMPVDKFLPASFERNGIAFMRMPPQGHMIVGYYKGEFGGRIKLYQAIDKYMNDKLWRPVMGAGYEEYLNNTVPDNDSSMVEMNICIPYL